MTMGCSTVIQCEVKVVLQGPFLCSMATIYFKKHLERPSAITPTVAAFEGRLVRRFWFFLLVCAFIMS